MIVLMHAKDYEPAVCCWVELYSLRLQPRQIEGLGLSRLLRLPRRRLLRLRAAPLQAVVASQVEIIASQVETFSRENKILKEKQNYQGKTKHIG